MTAVQVVCCRRRAGAEAPTRGGMTKRGCPMSDDRDHTVATAAVTSDEKPYGVPIDAGGHALRDDDGQRATLAEIAERTPGTKTVRAGTEIRTITEAARPGARRATLRPFQKHAFLR